MEEKVFERCDDDVGDKKFRVSDACLLEGWESVSSFISVFWAPSLRGKCLFFPFFGGASLRVKCFFSFVFGAFHATLLQHVVLIGYGVSSCTLFSAGERQGSKEGVR
jgi:hypothetical protein